MSSLYDKWAGNINANAIENVSWCNTRWKQLPIVYWSVSAATFLQITHCL